MNDREMLELTAKAAGIRLHIWGAKGAENFADMDGPRGQQWNPLIDDGDALRLAVKLWIIVAPVDNRPDEQLFTAAYRFKGPERADIPHGNDAMEATRRAIVRVAAEIGKAML